MKDEGAVRSVWTVLLICNFMSVGHLPSHLFGHELMNRTVRITTSDPLCSKYNILLWYNNRVMD